MILIHNEIVSIRVDDHDAQVLKQLCHYAACCMADEHGTNFVFTPPVNVNDVKRFIKIIIDGKDGEEIPS